MGGLGRDGIAGMLRIPHRREIHACDNAARLRTGVFRGSAAAAVHAPDGVTVIDLSSGEVLRDWTCNERRTTVLDVAISMDAVQMLSADERGCWVSPLLGDTGVPRRQGPSPGSARPRAGALALVEGEPWTAVWQEDGIWFSRGGSENRPLLADAYRTMSAGQIELLAAGDEDQSVFVSAFEQGSSRIAGEAVGYGSQGWEAQALQVEGGRLEAPGSYGDIWDAWTGLLHGVPVVAYPGPASVQVRHLADGRPVAARVLGEERADPAPASVAFAGDLVALAYRDRVEVRRWEDFTPLHKRAIEDGVLVRLLAAHGRTWLVVATERVLLVEELHPQPTRRTTPAPRSWRSLTVAPGVGAVAGLGAGGRAWLIGGRHGEFVKDRATPFPLGRRSWDTVELGRRLTVERLYLCGQKWSVVGYAIPEISSWVRPVDRDPAVAMVEAGDDVVTLRESGTVEVGRIAGPSRTRWTESGEVVRLLAPTISTGPHRWDREAPVIVVAVDEFGEFGRILLRDPATGDELAHYPTGMLVDVAAAWVGGSLWVAAAIGIPHGLEVLSWDGLALTRKHVAFGQRPTKVAVAGTTMPVVAALDDIAVTLLDGRTGDPLGRADLDSQWCVLVEGPDGAEFLAGNELVGLPNGNSFGRERAAGPLARRIAPGDLGYLRTP